ncbi:MAG: hypothetical protein PUF37_01900 [Prevotellaceae bacterium]|nr:hypothetical protein [Prevotellaceae bacterium]
MDMIHHIGEELQLHIPLAKVPEIFLSTTEPRKTYANSCANKDHIDQPRPPREIPGIGDMECRQQIFRIRSRDRIRLTDPYLMGAGRQTRQDDAEVIHRHPVVALIHAVVTVARPHGQHIMGNKIQNDMTVIGTEGNRTTGNIIAMTEIGIQLVE